MLCMRLDCVLLICGLCFDCVSLLVVWLVFDCICFLGCCVVLICMLHVWLRLGMIA